MNVITSKGGMLRGGHYHKLNTEAFYIVSGSCKVMAYKGEEKEEFEFKAGDFFGFLHMFFMSFIIMRIPCL